MPFWLSQASATTPFCGEQGSFGDQSDKDGHTHTTESQGELQDSALSYNTSAVGRTSQLGLDSSGLQSGQEAATTDDIAQQLCRQFAHLLRNRQEVADARLEAQQALQRSNALRHLFCESQHKLMSYIRDKAPGNEFDKDQFLSLCNTAITDSNAADAQAITASVVQGKLSSLEYGLRELEATSLQQLKSLLIRTGAWANAQLESECLQKDLPKISQQSPSPIIEPLLKSYYARAGQVGLLGEEMADLDTEYQQALSLRTLKSDQGNPPSEPETHYEQEYKSSRAAIEKRLGDAITAAEDAKRQCVLADLEPDPFLSDTSFDDFRLPEPLLITPAHEEQNVHGHSETPNLDNSESANADRKQAMVLQWASQIPAVDEECTVPLVTKEEVDAINRIELEKWPFQHVQRPRRHSSESHLRWKGNESQKELNDI
ncbi:hypothetical protein CKM354_000868800 [Cercospora kikuchii]|uniref:Uncharacterized protein n=1 Tax=Cercospora kikuchii TaxID=84275 RepID=A0A9P3FFJ8_9PEZI|nr:uncharacterized protein CKM354_000868800 [Cercospora kikuchii]GIZ45526.1 hypothetical protein CKM354_000868800 [Cercospora kikuchii]